MSHLCFKRTIRAASISENTWPSYGGRSVHHKYYKHDPPTEGRKKWPNSRALLTEGGCYGRSLL